MLLRPWGGAAGACELMDQRDIPGQARRQQPHLSQRCAQRHWLAILCQVRARGCCDPSCMVCGGGPSERASGRGCAGPVPVVAAPESRKTARSLHAVLGTCLGYQGAPLGLHLQQLSPFRHKCLGSVACLPCSTRCSCTCCEPLLYTAAPWRECDLAVPRSCLHDHVPDANVDLVCRPDVSICIPCFAECLPVRCVPSVAAFTTSVAAARRSSSNLASTTAGGART